MRLTDSPPLVRLAFLILFVKASIACHGRRKTRADMRLGTTELVRWVSAAEGNATHRLKTNSLSCALLTHPTSCSHFGLCRVIVRKRRAGCVKTTPRHRDSGHGERGRCVIEDSTHPTDLDPLLRFLLSSLFVPFDARTFASGIAPRIGLTPEVGGFARLDHGLAHRGHGKCVR